MKKLTRRAARFKGITVGLDVHQSFLEYVILKACGEEECGGRVAGNPEGLGTLLGKVGRRKAQFVLEAGSSSLWVRDALVSRVGLERVHVAQPHRVRPIASSLEKNDANDAWWLAYLCQEGRLPEAYVPDGEVRELRIATRELRSAVNRRADLIRRLRAHLVQSGCRLTRKNFHTVEARAETRALIGQTTGMRRMALERLLVAIEQGDEEVKGWREVVREEGGRSEVVKTMVREMDGLGEITAAVVYAEMGDPRRYGRAKSFAGATGLCPGYRESGGHRSRVGMSRAGSSAVRWALTRAVLATLRCRGGSGGKVRQWVVRRCRTRPRRVVMVSAARKLAEGVWRLFALGESFDLGRAFPGGTAA